MPSLSGIVPVLASPFNEEGEVDYGSAEALVENAIQDGADAVALFGLASEYYKLADDEREQLLKNTVAVVRKRVPVIASITQHSTELAVRQARRSEEKGVDFIMILPPFFLNPPLDAVLRHVECVASAVRIPAILQYAPAQTGLSPEILKRLPVSIVKVDASPSRPALEALPAGRISLIGYMGLDLPDAVAAGCAGCMPTASLVSAFRRLWLLLGQDRIEAREYHRRMLPLLQFMMQSIEFLIAAEKHLLVRVRAIRSAYCRKPAVVIGPEQIDLLFRYFGQL